MLHHNVDYTCVLPAVITTRNPAISKLSWSLMSRKQIVFIFYVCCSLYGALNGNSWQYDGIVYQFKDLGRNRNAHAKFVGVEYCDCIRLYKSTAQQLFSGMCWFRIASVCVDFSTVMFSIADGVMMWLTIFFWWKPYISYEMIFWRTCFVTLS